jgi:hypothetical protein
MFQKARFGDWNRPWPFQGKPLALSLLGTFLILQRCSQTLRSRIISHLHNAMMLGSADADSEAPPPLTNSIYKATKKYSNADEFISKLQLPFKKQVH